MPDLTANRTLVKSPPELWSELSEVESLALHLGKFGEIAISRLEPEHTVAWEGEYARGTVELEASGWGTKVTLNAELASAPQPVAAEPVAAPVAAEPVAAEAAPRARRQSWLRRWLSRQRHSYPESANRDEPEAAAGRDRPAVGSDLAQVVLDEALDNLGAAHHRPFSRRG
ncbi:MAG: hypothetical protein ACR2J6_00975 [Thermoleophilaceae bacterium]